MLFTAKVSKVQPGRHLEATLRLLPGLQNRSRTPQITRLDLTWQRNENFEARMRNRWLPSTLLYSRDPQDYTPAGCGFGRVTETGLEVVLRYCVVGGC